MGSALIRENFSTINQENHDVVVEKTKNEVLNMLKSTIRPEFLNRIDEIIMFEPLKQSEIAQVVRIQMESLVKMLKNNSVQLQFTDAAVNLIAELGFDPEFGARPVKRVIQRQVLDVLSKRLLAGIVNHDAPIIIDAKDGALEFKN